MERDELNRKSKPELEEIARSRGIADPQMKAKETLVNALADDGSELYAWTMDDLVAEARARGIEGPTTMTKDDLVAALRRR